MTAPVPSAAPGERAPSGYKLVIVPDELAPDEPDWEECKRQAEVATGLKVEQHTFSILKREVRRWIAHRNAASPALQAESAIQHLREAWATLHNLSADMEAGPIKQQMQKRAVCLRQYLDGLELPDGTYASPALQAETQGVGDLSWLSTSQFTGDERIAYLAGYRDRGHLGTGTAAAPTGQWIDDPHDIEQGQMLNPEWLKLHGLTAKEGSLTYASPALQAEPVPDINGKPATAHSLLAALVDIYDDGQNAPPEYRCYDENAWREVLTAARNFLATMAAEPVEGAPPALQAEPHPSGQSEEFIKGWNSHRRDMEELGQSARPALHAAPTDAQIEAAFRDVWGVWGVTMIDMPHMHFARAVLALAAPGKPHGAYAEVQAERARQDEQWGGPSHDDQHDPVDWDGFIEYQAYWGREQDPRRRFVKIAALAIAAIESIDRKSQGKPQGA